MKVAAVLIALFVTLGCSYTEPAPAFGDLLGSWRLYEVGGSPGFGYYVTPVPSEPLQFITFTRSGGLVRQGKDLPYFFDVPNYRVESAQTNDRLIFLKSLSDQTGVGVAFQIRNDTLRITPTCYEGCHFGFVRIR